MAAMGAITAARLDHSDDPVTAHRVIDHVEVTRLENVERQLDTWHDNRSGKGKDGNGVGQGFKRGKKGRACHVR